MDYPRLCDELFAKIEEHLDEHAIELDYESNGSLCEITLANTSQLIINRQPAMAEIWLAAKSGGYHFRYIAGKWHDRRNDTEFFACLDTCLAAQE